MILSRYVNTFGLAMRRRYGVRIHKIAIDAGFTCPNIDGSKGRGGCSFCNNDSFSPNGRHPAPIPQQIEAGRQVIRKRTGARLYLAYFQAYSNSYADPAELDRIYRQALGEPDVIGLSVGTRPDCISEPVLDLLAGYRDEGYEVWLELGLQSAFDETLERVNRGHGFSAYRDAVLGAQQRHIPVCTHLIIGLPGETPEDSLMSLERVLELGVDGLKLHPLHVVRGSRLAGVWQRGEYQPLDLDTYTETAAEMIRRTPAQVIFHRVTATAPRHILLAPQWCAKKWLVINRITELLARSAASHADPSLSPGHHEICLEH